MNIEEKQIYLVLSPHLNYYHSFRGDSEGTSGFGLDLEIMDNIVKTVSRLEDQGYSQGKIPISWDYADLFFTIPLQQKYQPDILKIVKKRLQANLDEVTVGSWGNCAPSILDGEEFRTQINWFMEDDLGYGITQIFGVKPTPYIRTQEMMYTPGMIEHLQALGIEGILLYYSVIPFDVTRPFLKPKLDWEQQYGLVKLQSTESSASITMVPTYGFGDILDHLSLKCWIKEIRSKQQSGEIQGHALLCINFDMDSYTWKGISMPKLLQWMPNIGGITELIHTAEKFPYVQISTLNNAISHLQVKGSVVLREDTADGCFNGYYNWAQKYSNTFYWTVGERARYLKSCVQTLLSKNLISEQTAKINTLLFGNGSKDNTYLKNHILFSSTTNFGMSMPFNHPHRQKTAMIYGLNAHNKAEEAFSIALQEFIESLSNTSNEVAKVDSEQRWDVFILPIDIQGKDAQEIVNLPSQLFFSTPLPNGMNPLLCDVQSSDVGIKNNFHFEVNSDKMEGICSADILKNRNFVKFQVHDKYLGQDHDKINSQKSEEISSVRKVTFTNGVLSNGKLQIKFSKEGKITSLIFKEKEFTQTSLLESAVGFGLEPKWNRIACKNYIIHDLDEKSSENPKRSKSIQIAGEFEILPGHFSKIVRILTLYADLPYLFVKTRFLLPNIEGNVSIDKGVYSIGIKYDDRWQEIMPCEIAPSITSKSRPLRIWKHNFMGITSYFDLDFAEIDPLNKDIDCLVANVSNGWMGVDNGEKGLAVGFNALKAANFAFSPLKIKHQGFKAQSEEINNSKSNHIRNQQVKINPFGTYYGKEFHYWSTGTGHAQKVIPEYSTTYRSTAPTFSGKNIEFDLVLAPYIGDHPPDEIQSFLGHYSFPPLVIWRNQQSNLLYTNYENLNIATRKLMDDYQIEDVMNLSYLEWVELINQQKEKERKQRDDTHFKLSSMLTLIWDALKSKFC